MQEMPIFGERLTQGKFEAKYLIKISSENCKGDDRKRKYKGEKKLMSVAAATSISDWQKTGNSRFGSPT